MGSVVGVRGWFERRKSYLLRWALVAFNRWTAYYEEYHTSCSFRARAIMLTMLCCVDIESSTRRREMSSLVALHLRIAEDFATSANAHVTNLPHRHRTRKSQDFKFRTEI